MKKWQILEFDGKPYYAFVPEGDKPLPDEIITDPEQVDEKLDLAVEEELKVKKTKDENIINNMKQERYLEEEEYDSMEEKWYNHVDCILNENAEETEELNMKPIILNGETIDDKTVDGDLYQVKVEGSMVTIEKLMSNTEVNTKANEDQIEDVDDKEDVNDEDDVNDEEDVKSEEDVNDEEDVKDEEDVNDEENVNDQEDENEGEIEYLDEEMLNVLITQHGNNETSHRNNLRSSTRVTKSTKNLNEALKCKLCSETFDTILSFRKHVAWTHKKKMCLREDGAYICAVCGFKTQKKSSFAAHLDRKHDTWSRKRSNNTKFPCTACGFVCRSKHSLQSHFTRKHTDNYEHQCNFCSKKFKVKGDLTNHIRFHHKEKPVKCDVCGKLCLNSGSLYVHQKWAHYKPKYECHICKRRMVTQENLDQHLLTQHEKRDKIICAECGKTFAKKDSFKRHMVVHTGCKPYSCIICEKPFARRSQLRQHLLIHTGKRPFVCDICGKAFTQKPGLICHRKTHPGSHPPLPVMPIADIVKEFTDGYVQEINARENEENIDEEI